MKVVINDCFGGYSLSAKAVKRMAELQGKECYFFEDGMGNEPYREIPMKECTSFWSAFTVKNPDEVMKRKKEWNEMTIKEKESDGDVYDSISLDTRPEPRTDPLLIQVIEELGKKANGYCASLKIVEIPDGVDYKISEYDGSEHIAEKHRTWG